MKKATTDAHPLWKNGDYLLLWSGQVVSSLGSQVSNLALPLLLLALTHSPAQAGLAGLLRTLPYLLVSLPAGALVDRWDRKRVMLICDTGRALSLASIVVAAWLQDLTLLQIYFVALLEGTLFVFFNLAEVACLPRVVGKEQLPAAVAQNSAVLNIAALLGGPLGGILYGLSRLLPFAADAVSYLLSVLSLFAIKTSFQGDRVAPSRHLWQEIREGLTWLWQHPLIRALAILTGCFNLLTAGFDLLLIVLLQSLHASPFIIGLVFALSGLGGIASSLLAPVLQKYLSFSQIVLGCCWLTVLLWPLYALLHSIFAVAIISVVIFFGTNPYNVVVISYRSAIIPDELQGRVNSVYRLVAFAGQPLGVGLLGLILQVFSVIPTILIFEAGFLLMAIGATLNPPIRRAR